MADYPNCTYHGCDIPYTIDQNPMKDQLIFKHGNVVKGLPYEYNTFDFVHMRALIAALTKEEWPIVIKEILHVTKPGGVVHCKNPTWKQLPEKSLVPFYKLVAAIHTACQARDQNPEIALKLKDPVLENDNVEVLRVVTRSFSGSLYTKSIIE
ncbi:hypothetical protein RMATCC62417_18056 [Rhizopus microsporus]|nr:hypothetical protein RMATCC62417_18056 [Rhizopus microsporus]